MTIEESLSILRDCPLLEGMDSKEAAQLLRCIAARVETVERGGCFLSQGEENRCIYIVVQGSAVGERVSADGTAVTVGEFSGGDVFGDVLSGSSAVSIVNVCAATECTVIKFNFDDMLNPCAESRALQSILLRNLINAISDKYFLLSERVALLALPSLRAKIAAYLLGQQKRLGGGDVFTVAHTREEMARYLGCERSALSREISRMAREGLFTTDRRRFAILDAPALSLLAE